MTEQKQADRTSLVPKFTFATSLEEQEAQLKSNPLTRRFVESRKKMSGDPHRPTFHYVNPENLLNDSNGLCFWQGRWHLFYQAYPPEDSRQQWGHAVSDDLVRWRDLPYAIYPDPEHCCYSGATLVEESRVIAMYHGTGAGNMVAISTDPLLLNWEKLTGDAVIPMLLPEAPPDGDDRPRFRHALGAIDRQTGGVFDPCIWKKDGFYYSISGGSLPEGPGGKIVPAEFLFRSKDLVSWDYLHPFVEGDRFTLLGDDGAVPYFWPIGDRHLLLFSSHMSGPQYLLGDYDKQSDKFVATTHGEFNFGSYTPGGVHAPSATPDGEGGIIVIFNMNHGKPTEGWDQIMSLPRRLTLIAEDTLGIEPAGDIASLRRDHHRVEAMTLPANQEVVLENIRGNSMEIIAELDTKGAPMVELNVLRSPDKQEFTRIAFFRERGYTNRKHRTGPRHSLISIDSSYSSLCPDVLSRAPETGPVGIEPEEPLQLRVFVDRSVVEVFVNGKQCVAMRVYPGREDSLGVSLRSQGRDAELRFLDAWQMVNIYE